MLRCLRTDRFQITVTANKAPSHAHIKRERAHIVREQHENIGAVFTLKENNATAGCQTGIPPGVADIIGTSESQI